TVRWMRSPRERWCGECDESPRKWFLLRNEGSKEEGKALSRRIDVNGKRVTVRLGRGENIVGADPPQQVRVFKHLKGEAVAFGDPAFPDILGAFHFLDA